MVPIAECCPPTVGSMSWVIPIAERGLGLPRSRSDIFRKKSISLRVNLSFRINFLEFELLRVYQQAPSPRRPSVHYHNVWKFKKLTNSTGAFGVYSTRLCNWYTSKDRWNFHSGMFGVLCNPCLLKGDATVVFCTALFTENTAWNTIKVHTHSLHVCLYISFDSI